MSIDRLHLRSRLDMPAVLGGLVEGGAASAGLSDNTLLLLLSLLLSLWWWLEVATLPAAIGMV
jgi:hypothetical protein